MAYELKGVKHHILEQAQYYMDKGHAGYRVTSPFTSERDHPITGEVKAHPAIDLTGAYGWNAVDWIIAPWDGKIIGKKDGVTLSAVNKDDVAKIQAQGVTGGNWVKIDHGNGYESQYLHLAVNTVNKKAIGDTVKKGERLGYMGATGMSTGAHLHFAIFKDKIAVNPEPYLLGEKTIEGVDGMGFIKLTKSLIKGDTDREAVKLLQLRLCQLSEAMEKEVRGHSFTKAGEPDGGYGDKMVLTMKKLQSYIGLTQTGNLDDKTRSYLNNSLKEYADMHTQFEGAVARADDLDQALVKSRQEVDEIRVDLNEADRKLGEIKYALQVLKEV